MFVTANRDVRNEGDVAAPLRRGHPVGQRLVEDEELSTPFVRQQRDAVAARGHIGRDVGASKCHVNWLHGV
jgi:hypothetical protein